MGLAQTILAQNNTVWSYLKSISIVVILLCVGITIAQQHIHIQAREELYHLNEVLVSELVNQSMTQDVYQEFQRSITTIKKLRRGSHIVSILASTVASVVVIVGLYLIISVRRRAQELLTEKEATYRASKDENNIVLQGVAHEISSWMGGVIGGCEFLVSDLEAIQFQNVTPACSNCPRLESIPMYLPILVDMNNTLKDASIMIENLRGYGKMSRYEKLEIVPLKNILRQAIRYSQFADATRLLPKECLRYTDHTKGRDFTIHISPSGFITVIQNLIKNAMEAVYEMKVRTPELVPFVNVQLAHTDDALVLTIADNGIGMTQAAQDRYFGLYETTKSNGTGIGLYLVRTNLAKMNIPYRIESKPDLGTTFTLTIPIVSVIEESLDKSIPSSTIAVQVDSKSVFGYCSCTDIDDRRVVLDISTIHDNITKVVVGDDAVVHYTVNRKPIKIIGKVVHVDDYVLHVEITPFFKEQLLNLMYETL